MSIKRKRVDKNVSAALKVVLVEQKNKHLDAAAAIR